MRPSMPGGLFDSPDDAPGCACDRTAPRGRNPRGQGEWLRAEIVDAALRLLDELADDQALSLRAVHDAQSGAADPVAALRAGTAVLVPTTEPPAILIRRRLRRRTRRWG